MTPLLLAIALSQTPSAVTVQLKDQPKGLDFEGNRARNLMYSPSRVEDDRSAVKKAPTDLKWAGLVALGNDGGRVLVGRSDDKLFIDANGNGDLTDDPAVPVTRIEPKEAGGSVSFQATAALPAKYRSGKKTWTNPYGLNFYWVEGRQGLFYFRASARTGTVTLGGRTLEVFLAESRNDGVFGRRWDTAQGAEPLPRYVFTLQGGDIDPRGTFIIDGVNYLADISPDGRTIKFEPSFRVVANPATKAAAAAAPRDERPLLAAGTAAPDFTVENYEGGTDTLSAHKGKVVILKFWASWCGPCKASMPHFEEVYAKAKPKGVDLLAVAVSDERDPYRKWVDANKDKYHFPFSYDPAGTDRTKSISGTLYNVTGIPTVYIIDRDGKVAASIVGFAGANDHRVEEALAKLGVEL